MIFGAMTNETKNKTGETTHAEFQFSRVNFVFVCQLDIFLVHRSSNFH